MAKKKGKREEAFTFPEFDRGEYRTKEVRDSKVAIFAVFYAVIDSTWYACRAGGFALD